VSHLIFDIQATAGKLIPELIMVISACLFFLIAPFTGDSQQRRSTFAQSRWSLLTLCVFLAAAGWSIFAPAASDATPFGAFRVDALAVLARVLACVSGIMLLLMCWNRIDQDAIAEHHACLMLIVAGVNLVGLANDLVGLFLGLELVSISTYLLLYLGRKDRSGKEAAAKYFLLSVFSSAIVLFGFSYYYGVAGTTNLYAIKSAIISGSAQAMPAILGIGLVMIVAGLGFRMTSVPFHFYAPDVFQGSHLTAAAMLSLLPKVAGFVALLKLVSATPIHEALGALWTPVGKLEVVLFILAMASMVIGNVMALQQSNLRRMLAWSSVAHTGYLLVGVAVADQVASAVRPETAVLFYLVAYGVMTLGAFGILAMLTRQGSEIQTFDQLRGLGRQMPLAAATMTVIMFGLTGLPPTVGFLGKWNLFVAAWTSETSMGVWLAVALAINAAIAAVYYLRVVAAMFMLPPIESQAARSVPQRTPASRRVFEYSAPQAIGAVFCVAVTIGLFIAPNWLWKFINQASF
jgi:NADH-quinone oxidoreductase subunit N